MGTKKDVHVLIGVPSQEIWMAEFGMCLGFLLSWSMRNQVLARSRAEKIDVINYKGSILPYLRERIVRHAKEIEATHLLFLDSDQTFPKDLIRQMLGHELPVVAANIPTKSTPASPTARLKSSCVGGQLVFSHDRSGIQEVWRVGTGVMLIDMKVFCILEEPYFSMYWDSQVGQYRGEDWVFCEKLEEAGIPIYVDHTISNKVGHVGMKIYSHEDIPTLESIQAQARDSMSSAA